LLFIPLQKVDAAQRLVYGHLDETPDRAGDIFDYPSSKPNFERWSEDMRKASDGKSLGNIRAMHGLLAAGKLTDIRFDDANKSIGLCAQIVDDGEWAKVEAGVYTGFSPGGKYSRRWPDGAHTRYTGVPSEISLVDVPANPGATFTMIKADGEVTVMAFPVSKSAAGGDPAQEDPDGDGDDDETEDPQTEEDGEAEAQSSDPLDELRGQMAKIAGENDDLKKRVAALEAMPVPGGPVLRSVDRANDARGTRINEIEAMDDGPSKASALIRFQMDGR